MTLLNYGQPIGGITQVAYTVEDIDIAIAGWSANLGVGPWFMRGPFKPANALYRGAPTEMSLTLAMAFSGHLMIELIQQHDEAPSVYRETIERTGYGFHHFGVASDRFDEQAELYVRSGYELAFSDLTPLGTRVGYFDTRGGLPGMIELIEMNEAQERRYTRMHAAAIAWDGTDLVRRV